MRGQALRRPICAERSGRHSTGPPARLRGGQPLAGRNPLGRVGYAGHSGLHGSAAESRWDAQLGQLGQGPPVYCSEWSAGEGSRLGRGKPPSHQPAVNLGNCLPSHSIVLLIRYLRNQSHCPGPAHLAAQHLRQLRARRPHQHPRGGATHSHRALPPTTPGPSPAQGHPCFPANGPGAATPRQYGRQGRQAAGYPTGRQLPAEPAATSGRRFAQGPDKNRGSLKPSWASRL